MTDFYRDRVRTWPTPVRQFSAAILAAVSYMYRLPGILLPWPVARIKWLVARFPDGTSDKIMCATVFLLVVLGGGAKLALRQWTHTNPDLNGLYIAVATSLFTVAQLNQSRFGSYLRYATGALLAGTLTLVAIALAANSQYGGFVQRKDYADCQKVMMVATSHPPRADSYLATTLRGVADRLCRAEIQVTASGVVDPPAAPKKS